MKRFLKGLAGWLLFLAVTWTLPSAWCRRDAARWLGNGDGVAEKLATGVARRMAGELTRSQFQTGHGTFDGEWLFGSYVTAGLGFLQLAVAHPDKATQHIGRAEACIARVLSDEVRQFDADAWRKHDPLAALGSRQDHAAYLGYLNLLLGFDRLLHPETDYAALNDRITGHLLARLEATPGLLLDSYPVETYPVDNCAVIAGVALHQRATGRDHRELLARWSARCREKWIDPKTGLLFQAWDRSDDSPADVPRGSGTAFGLYFLSFADAALARDLYAGLSRTLGDGLFGFGAFREYPWGQAGSGDIDSGPIVFGMGLSATGFGIAGARLFGDHPRFSRLYASATLAGAPVETDTEFQFATGGPLGNSILLAMLTALPPEQLPPERRVP